MSRTSRRAGQPRRPHPLPAQPAGGWRAGHAGAAPAASAAALRRRAAREPRSEPSRRQEPPRASGRSLASAPEPARERADSHRRTGQTVYHTSAVYGGQAGAEAGKAAHDRRDGDRGGARRAGGGARARADGLQAEQPRRRIRHDPDRVPRRSRTGSRSPRRSSPRGRRVTSRRPRTTRTSPAAAVGRARGLREGPEPEEVRRLARRCRRRDRVNGREAQGERHVRGQRVGRDGQRLSRRCAASGRTIPRSSPTSSRTRPSGSSPGSPTWSRPT